MTESMNLDTSDIVESLDEFESLDTIEAINTILNHEDQGVNKDIRSEVDMMPDFPGDVMEMKEEVISQVQTGKESEEEELMEETIAYDDISDSNSIIENVEMDHQNETSSVIQNDNIFIKRIRDLENNEFIIPDQVPVRTFDESESDKEFEDIDGMITDNVTDGTIIEETEESTIIGESEETNAEEPVDMETDKLDEEEPEEKIEINTNVVTSGVYVVNASGALTPTLAQTVVPNKLLSNKDSPQRLTRVVLPKSEVTTGQGLRLVTSQSKMKTFTFEEAKQLGLLNFSLTASKSFVSKLVLPKKTVTVVKSPTKILPAPPNLNKTQKVLIRNAGCNLKSGTFIATTAAPGSSPGVIRIPATQTTQLHIPANSKQVQYVKLVGGGKMSGTTLVPVSALSSKAYPVALTTSILNAQPATFKVLPISTQQQTVAPVVTNAIATSSTQRILIPAPAPSPQEITTQQHQINTQPIVMAGQVATTNSVQHQNNRTNVVMVPQGLLNQITKENKTPTPTPNPTKTSSVYNGKRTSSTPPCLKVQEEVIVKTEITKPEIEEAFVEANGIRPRKPCNCTKSMCLKLYCDCFANGEFCHQCNCTTCYNNLVHEEERQRAIKSCLERNPTAFRPKIGKTFVGSEERRHNKGCNCRRSGCLKNYCECYEAKIPCSKNCKCVGCKNTETFLKRGIGSMEEESFALKDKSDNIFTRNHNDFHILANHRQILNLSPQLVEATCQCLVAQVEGWSKNSESNDIEFAQTLVIEELGRCLSQLIDCVNRSISQVPAAS